MPFALNVMRLAILFSGQGQQTAEHLGFLREHVGKSSAAALKNALGMAWTERDPPINELSANVIAQPLIFGFEMLWWERLAPYLPTPICAAGYSLGEMAACSAAGLFSECAGIALCHERAKLMDANTSGDVTMLAVLGIGEEKVAEVSSQFGLEMAIRNSPTHFVVTGTVAAINGAVDRFQAAGASKLTPVAVRTPSHTRFLRAASEAFAKTLEPYSQGNLMFPVISAVSSGEFSCNGQMIVCLP